MKTLNFKPTGNRTLSVGMRKVSLCLLLALSVISCKKNGLEGSSSTGIPSVKVPIAPVSAAIPPDFSIALLPDIQFMTDPGPEGGLEVMLTKELKWILDNRAAENIVYVGGLGDISDSGDQSWSDPQWTRVQNNFYGNKTGYAKGLETPLTGFPYGIPYGLCTGNHDQRISGGVEGPDKPCAKYNSKLGRSHFANSSHPYYGGSYTTANNNSHYQKFSVGTGTNKMDFMVININYDLEHSVPAVTQWAYNLCTANPNSKVIIITHYMSSTATPAAFSTQGLAIWNKMKGLNNVFMFAGGHLTGEGYRQDTYNGKTIKTFQTDYQGWANGGEGYFRLMKFSAANDLITVRTYSPYMNTWQTDWNSQFTRPWFFPSRVADFNKDGNTDAAVFQPNGIWKVNGMADVDFGEPGDIPVPGDYNGDGIQQIAIWRPSTANWAISGLGNFVWGDPNSADLPVPGDYNGDGKLEIAIWRPSTAAWAVDNGAPYVIWGDPNSADIPVPGDYNGDGKTDRAIWRPSNATWYVQGVGNTVYGEPNSGDIPVPGDYNGDGKTDFAIFRPSNNTWYLASATGAVYGEAGDIPAPGDYDGNGTTDIAMFRPSNNTFYTQVGVGGAVVGTAGAKPVALPYHIRKFFFP